MSCLTSGECHKRCRPTFVSYKLLLEIFCVPICLPVCLPPSLPVSLSFCLPICLPVSLPVCLAVSTCLHECYCPLPILSMIAPCLCVWVCMLPSVRLSVLSSFIHSFIHIEHLYSASSRKLLRNSPNTSTAKQSSFKVRKKFPTFLLSIHRFLPAFVHEGMGWVAVWCFSVCLHLPAAIFIAKTMDLMKHAGALDHHWPSHWSCPISLRGRP